MKKGEVRGLDVYKGPIENRYENYRFWLVTLL